MRFLDHVRGIVGWNRPCPVTPIVDAPHGREAAVRHHLDTAAALRNYDPKKHLDQEELTTTVVYDDVASSTPGDLAPLDTPLTQREFRDLLRFLDSLTAPNLNERLEATIPESVPSGLPLDGF